MNQKITLNTIQERINKTQLKANEILKELDRVMYELNELKSWEERLIKMQDVVDSYKEEN